MTENKSLEQLRTELEEMKKEKTQVEHQLQRKQNMLSYREGNNRKERNHRLIVRGAIFEKYFPMIKELSEQELSETLSLMDIEAVSKELKEAITQVRREVNS